MILCRDKIKLSNTLTSSAFSGMNNANERLSNYFNIFGEIYNDCFPLKTKKSIIKC